MLSQEKPLERKFCAWLKSIDGKPVKGPSYTDKGIPDRICVLPHGGGTVWIEFKGNTYYQLTPMQQVWRERIIDSSPDRYFLVDTEEDLKHVIDACKRFMNMLQ